MESFFLAFIVNAFIGLAVGYIWGCRDAFKVGYERGVRTTEVRLQSITTSKPDNQPSVKSNSK